MAERIHITADADLKEFLPRYLENRKRDLETLRRAAEKSDFRTVQVISHKIRGHAVSYGFDFLSGICGIMERAAGEKKLEIIVSLLNEYRDYIERVDLN
jgi:HPt (histidine-containing phosphotransfer) domain-containing protein